jgi:hypothetical protein
LKQNKFLFQKNSRFLQNFHKVNESQTNPHEEERDGNRREFVEEHERRFMTTCTNQEKNMKRKVMVGGANQKKHEMEGNGNMFKL